jgi:hypothetical protein
MESGAKGCEVIVSGKLRGQRAKSMKFVDGFMIHSGNPTRDYIDSAVTHVLLRQGRFVIFLYRVNLAPVVVILHPLPSDNMKAFLTFSKGSCSYVRNSPRMWQRQICYFDTAKLIIIANNCPPVFITYLLHLCVCVCTYVCM